MANNISLKPVDDYSASQGILNSLEPIFTPLLVNLPADQEATPAAGDKVLEPVAACADVAIDGDQALVNLNGIVITITALVKEHATNKDKLDDFSFSISTDPRLRTLKRSMVATRERINYFNPYFGTRSIKSQWLYDGDTLVGKEPELLAIIDDALIANADGLGLSSDMRDNLSQAISAYLCLIKTVVCSRNGVSHLVEASLAKFKSALTDLAPAADNVEVVEPSSVDAKEERGAVANTTNENSKEHLEPLGFIPVMPIISTKAPKAGGSIEPPKSKDAQPKAISSYNQGINDALILAKLTDSKLKVSNIQRKNLKHKKSALQPVSSIVFGVYEVKPCAYAVDLADAIDLSKAHAMDHICSDFSITELEPFFNQLDALLDKYQGSIKARIYRRSRIFDAVNKDALLFPAADIRQALESLIPDILECIKCNANAFSFEYDEVFQVFITHQLKTWGDTVAIFASEIDDHVWALSKREIKALSSYLDDSGRKKATLRDQRRASNPLRTIPRTYKTSLHDVVSICRKADISLGTPIYLLGSSKEPIIYHLGAKGPVLDIKAFKNALAKSLKSFGCNSLIFAALNQFDEALAFYGVGSSERIIFNKTRLYPLNALLGKDLALKRALRSSVYVTMGKALKEIFIEPTIVKAALCSFIKSFSALIQVLIYDNYWHVDYAKEAVTFSAHSFTADAVKDDAA